jgi:KDO2-lipid IV(A) lauroyltransferase
MEKIAGALTYWGYSAAWKIIRTLPEKFTYRSADRIADRLTKKNGVSVTRLRNNYARVHPEYDAEQLANLTNLGMRSYLRYWVDTFRSPFWSIDRTLATVSIDHEEYLRDPLAQGKGCIVALPHAGNWDHAGAYFCATGAPLVTVAEHLKPEKLFQKFLRHREAIGMEVLALDARVIGVLATRLRKGRLVALVADRDLSESGIPVIFCGGNTRMPAGPAILAIQTGAPLITAFVSYTDSGIHISFGAQIPVPPSGSVSEKAAVMTQEMAARFEAVIKGKTEDWHMLQKVWLD